MDNIIFHLQFISMNNNTLKGKLNYQIAKYKNIKNSLSLHHKTIANGK